MKENSNGVSTPYPVFIESTPVDKVSLMSYVEYRFSKLAVKFKNWWFDNYFFVPFDKRSLKTRIMFKFGQFIIHKIFAPYSFSKYKSIKPKK